MRDWSRQPVTPRCDICAERRSDVLRFGLVRRPVAPNGKRTTMGAGGIWLCRQCWEGLVPMRESIKRLRVAG